MLIYSGFPPKMCWVWHKNLLSTELFFVSPRPGRMCKFHESLMGLRNFRKIFSGKISGGVKGLLCSLPRVCHWPGLLLLAQPRSQPIPGLCGRRCCVSWSWLSLPPSSRAPVGELGSPPVPEEQLLPWVALPGIPWHPQKFPGIPWHSLEFPSIPWHFLVFPGIPWKCKRAIQDSPPCSRSCEGQSPGIFFLGDIPGDGRRSATLTSVSQEMPKDPAEGPELSKLPQQVWPSPNALHSLSSSSALILPDVPKFSQFPHGSGLQATLCCWWQLQSQNRTFVCYPELTITSRLFNCMGKCSL